MTKAEFLQGFERVEEKINEVKTKLAAGFSVSDLRAAGFSVSDLRAAAIALARENLKILKAFEIDFSDAICMMMGENPQATWEQCKAQLEFAEAIVGIKLEREPVEAAEKVRPQ